MATIIEAAQALLGVCDGARSDDDRGFNGADAPFVHSMFERQWLTAKQLLALHRILGKYSKQLATHGFEYGTLEVPLAGPRTSATGAQGTPARTETVRPEPVKPTAPAPLPPATPPAFVLPPLAPWPVTGELIAHFPPQFTPRPQQREAIAQIERLFRDEGKRVVVLEMPTGGGKSIICMTAARAIEAAGGSTHFLTIQKQLQDQYTRDFPAPQIEVCKGRSNYRCGIEPGRPCHDAPCTDKGKGILPQCVTGGDDPHIRQAAVNLQLPPEVHHCPYWAQLTRCAQAPTTLFNFSSFLFQQRIGRFGSRTLMVVDEGHNIESQLMSYVTLELTEWTLSKIGVTIDRKITSRAELADWMREKEIFAKIDVRLEKIGKHEDEDVTDADEVIFDRMELEALRQLHSQITNFLAFLEKTEWVIETIDYRTRRGEPARKILARPLYAKNFAKELLFAKADRILVMSATILDVNVWAENLGLTREEVGHVQTPCDFPVANRPIHLEFCGNMGRKWFSPQENPKSPTKPLFVKKIRQLLDRHAGQRGMIHCHSFELSKILREEIASPRFLFQDEFDGDKGAMLAAHAERLDSVMVAPAMHEGFDLKDDLCRWQVICKIPWASLGDKVVKERAARDDRWYSWLCALKLVQSYGRPVRSKDDWATSYIIDSGYNGFVARWGRMLPAWFHEACQKYAPKEVRRA